MNIKWWGIPVLVIGALCGFLSGEISKTINKDNDGKKEKDAFIIKMIALAVTILGVLLTLDII